MDVCEGVELEILYTTKFDENSSLNTTYLAKEHMNNLDKLKAEERFAITHQGYSTGKLLEVIECQIHLDTGKVNYLCPKHII